MRHLTLTKTSDATVDSKPGDTVSYTVRLVNDGAGDYTAADPASLVDDLTGVLDDATFNGVAHSSAGPDPTYLAPRITWVGPLASGDEVRVTYEVVLKGGGDGHVRNVAWAPADPSTPGPTPDCATSPRPCDTESFDLPKLSITKTADRTQLTATGQTVTYTIVVTNPGPGDYTAAHRRVQRRPVGRRRRRGHRPGLGDRHVGHGELRRRAARVDRRPAGQRQRDHHLHGHLPGHRQPRPGQHRLRPGRRGADAGDGVRRAARRSSAPC